MFPLRFFLVHLFICHIDYSVNLISYREEDIMRLRDEKGMEREALDEEEGLYRDAETA